MTRNVRALLLAVMALFATGSLASETAMANEQGIFEETTDDYPVHVHGFATPPPAVTSYTILNTELKCDFATYSGELTTIDTTLAITPTYQKCQFGGRSATLNMNGCRFLLHIDQGTVHSWNAITDLFCPNGGFSIRVYDDAAHTQLQCTTVVKPKNGLTGATLTNETTAPHAIHIHGEVPGFEGTTQGACTFGFLINFSNAVFHLNATVEGTAGKEIAVGPHPFV